MTTDSPASFRQITNVLSESLYKAFGEVCPKRYGAPLELQRSDTPSNPQCVIFRIEGPPSIALEIQVTIIHVGGNVYDIATQVEDGRVRQFTYSEPASSGSSLSIAPYLGKKITNHVLDEVEQRLGKKLLSNQVQTEVA
jgi:hypothetical protein